MQMDKNNLAQYFTTNSVLKEKIYSFILNSPTLILEPCIGQGDLVTFVKDKLPDAVIDMYEVDQKIELLKGVDKKSVIYTNFLTHDIKKKYNTVIGNPPFIRTKKGNLYIDFTEKCYNLLEEKGELIFIVPSDFFKLTSASKLLNEMMENGSFTHIFHPHDEKLFENASIDVIIFRYYKNGSHDEEDEDKRLVLYNDKLVHIINNNGLITFSEEKNKNNVTFRDLFDIYVGLVSGKEEVYKNSELGTIDVLNGEDKLEKYIYIDEFPSNNDAINTYLLGHKSELIARGIRKFTDKNWFEWGALRNFGSVTKNLGKECIYIYNLTRRSNIAFIDDVHYFGGGLIMLIPKKKCDLNKIVEYLNSDVFKSNFLFSGRFKIGHRQISNSFIPNEILDI
jgi:adenine-specific DNA-methyltransferase